MLNNLRPGLTTSRGSELAALLTRTGKLTLGQSLEEMASPGSRYSASLASSLVQGTVILLLPFFFKAHYFLYLLSHSKYSASFTSSLVQDTVLPLLALSFKG